MIVRIENTPRKKKEKQRSYGRRTLHKQKMNQNCSLHCKRMQSFLLLFLIASIFAYEKICIFSDNDSIIDVKRDPNHDLIRVTSTSKIGESIKTYGYANVTLPEGLQSIEFILTDTKKNTGRYSYETPFKGVHLSLQYDHRRPLTGLCDFFTGILPCFNVKQCNTNGIYA